MAFQDGSYSPFERTYRCYPLCFIGKEHLENGDKIIMPASALHVLASLQIEYPMLFELRNPSADKVTYCGVLEFDADEGLIFLPYRMMQNMLLEEGDRVKVKNTSLAKGTYAKLQPHTKDFLDISNPKAILETSLRSYSCLTSGDTIVIAYNNKKYYIDIVETKPSSAVSIIETDCEVDFAPPLDYKEPEKPAASALLNKKQPEDEPAKKVPKFSPFTGSARRLDGGPLSQSVSPASSPMLKQHQPAVHNETNDSMSSKPASSQSSGRLVFGSRVNKPEMEAPKDAAKNSNQEQPQKEEEPKFKAFTGKKYSLK